jgi:uncharacterized protein (TIGR02246 family)/steroid delta-isomerase-like uncharacterized protein
MNNKNPSINSIGKTEGEIESKVRTEQERKVQSNIIVVRQALQVLNTGDISSVREIISPQYFNHESQVDPVRSELRGPEEFMDTVKNLRNAFPDLHYEEQETIASGDKVISILTVTGKHMGNFFVIPSTGREISYQAVHIHRIDNDGKIVEHRAIRDDLTFMMQLGLVGPSSKEYEPLFQAWKGLKYSQVSQQQTTKSSAENESAIRALYFQMIDGWNAGNGDVFAAPFAEDADLVGFDGTHLRGRQEIASFHQHLFDTFVKGSRLIGKVRSMRFLTPNVAIMHAVGGTIMAGQSDIDPERNSVHTIVVKKEDAAGRWRIVAFQNTRAQYIGRPEMIEALTEDLRREL